tara:strand:- start:357 stop:1469 length:1113 start_codon:yes stop_codon:yes gene_type:complete
MSAPFTPTIRRTPELNEILPKSKGMKIIGIIDNLPLKYIKGLDNENYVNDVRHDLSDTQTTIGKFQKKMQDGTYAPKVWGGPTLIATGEFHEDGNPMYELVTGWHRSSAMSNEGYLDGYFVIVTFVSENGSSANYWKRIWKSVENKKNADFVQNDRDEQDIIGITTQMILDGEIEFNKSDNSKEGIEKKTKAIENALKDQECTQSEIYLLLPKILANLGEKKGIVYPLVKKKWTELKETYEINNDDEYVKAVQFEKVKEKDYEFRFMMKFLTELVQNCTYDKNGRLLHIPEKYENVTILAKITNEGQKSKLLKIREEKCTFFEDNADIIIKGAKILSKLVENKTLPNVKFAPQLYGEKSVVVINKTNKSK